MKRTLRIALIGFGACLGLSLLAGIFNAITGNRPAQPRATVTAIAIGLVSRPSSTPQTVLTVAPTPPPAESTATAMTTDAPPVVEPTLPPPTAIPNEGVFVAPQGESVNVRSGPGINFAVVGSLAAGQSAKLIGRLADNSLVQIELGWVNTSVATVSGALDSVVIVEAPAPPAIDAAAPVATQAVVEAPQPAPVSVDVGECPSERPIKGNDGNNGLIFHVPESRSYKQTIPERCFATVDEARAAGFKAPGE